MAFRLLAGLGVLACASSAFVTSDDSQIPLQPQPAAERADGVLGTDGSPTTARGKKLHGRFLHITDMHPDPFYKVYSDTDKASACHRSRGPAGYYGAETTACDSPYTLIDETFKWVEQNLKGKIDFIIWTGDSARHDNDEHFPRNDKIVIDSNKKLVEKFEEVFWDKETLSLSIPVVPTFGNNDILPHNIFSIGPNKWTRLYLDIWKNMIPEAQRHQFVQGGWFWVEVIPNKLAVFSLNTMYFFDSNAAVDGCEDKGEPGYEHFEWLRVQLEFFRERGMKAILSGHVPPARSKGKRSWDETCWQKYALWLRQYRDVIIGSMYGHMNVEHFILQDFEAIDKKVAKGFSLDAKSAKKRDRKHEEHEEPEFTAASHKNYLWDLRKQWSQLPTPPRGVALDTTSRNHKKSKEDRFFEKIGGKWGERFGVSLVSASVVPNYFPSLRVIEYNITGLESALDDVPAMSYPAETEFEDLEDDEEINLDLPADELRKKKKKRKPRFKVPKGPSKSAPPGPAYSPQPLSWIGYRQYFANITKQNNDFVDPSSMDFEPTKWDDGKHAGKKPKRPKPKPLKFEYDVEYDTTDKKDVYRFGDSMSLRSFINLATRVGDYNPKKDHRFKKMIETTSEFDEDEDADVEADFEDDDEDTDSSFDQDEDEDEDEDDDDDDVEADKKKKKKHKKHKKHRKHKRRKIINKTWYGFVQRAFVSSVEPGDLDDSFGEPIRD